MESPINNNYLFAVLSQFGICHNLRSFGYKFHIKNLACVNFLSKKKRKKETGKKYKVKCKSLKFKVEMQKVKGIKYIAKKKGEKQKVL